MVINVIKMCFIFLIFFGELGIVKFYVILLFGNVKKENNNFLKVNIGLNMFLFN